MCRLFGFRSVIDSGVHRSLVEADNALGKQSESHPDGWGVAYYIDGAPHIAKAPSTALADRVFRRVSGVVSSRTVVAHIRKATVGDNTVLNTHPFQYGLWVFAHNGDVPEFERCRQQMVDAVAPRFRRFILGDTDSEVLFFLFLTQLSTYGPLDRRHGIETVMKALSETVIKARAIADTDDAPKPALLNFLVTNGQTLAAVQGGKELFWSTYKTRCSDRGVCPHLAPQCEAESKDGFVNHLLVASEPVQGENVWLEMEPGEMVGVDWRMRVARGRVGALAQ